MEPGDLWALALVLLAANAGLLAWFYSELDAPLGTILRRYSDSRGTYAKLAADPTTVAFDAHRTVTAPHPKRPTVTQTFLRPADQGVFSVLHPTTHPRHASRLHHFRRFGTMPAVDVHRFA